MEIYRNERNKLNNVHDMYYYVELMESLSHESVGLGTPMPTLTEKDNMHVHVVQSKYNIGLYS